MYMVHVDRALQIAEKPDEDGVLAFQLEVEVMSSVSNGPRVVAL